MDNIWISKVLITITIYYLLYLSYKKIGWNLKGNFDIKNPSFIIIPLIMLVCVIPSIIVLYVLIVVVIFGGTFNYLDTRPYWEQIVLIIGFVSLYFYVRIKLDELNKIKSNLVEISRCNDYGPATKIMGSL